ncbi:DNA polymerase delta subunit 3 [Trichoderma ghanense]|uniref:DNA polymerase delta subunit 3 n=1 Tax=Trichoderma ghanense TaxID=65468 RepID=A0ABY2GP46_9HYPO
MDEAKKYLSDRLLSEEVPVTYRLLSRALNLRVNVAKQKLYEFYQSQNASRPGSVHAAYLIYGSKTEDGHPDSGDTDMDSSAPEHEPLSDHVPTKTVTIVAEEKLKEVLAEYEQVSSFHIYSLAPFPQRDLAMLSDVSRSLSEYRNAEEPAKALDTYGIIANPQARKRDRKGRPQILAPTAPKPITKQESQASTPKPSQPEKAKPEARETPSTSADATPSSSAGKKPPATLKRGASGGIMQSFAKAAAKPPKPKPKPEPKAKDEDTSMALSDDGEADEEDVLPPQKTVDHEALKRARKEREEALMRMMQDPEEDVREEAKKDDEQSDEEMEEASEPEPEPETEPEPEQQPKEEKEPTEVVSNSSNGRRRGKRRVMKKKRILDDQGYMVTIQEAAWESFSEDEAPAPAAAKATPTPTPASSAQKAKKAAAGKGGSQGSIMSFFSKK